MDNIIDLRDIRPHKDNTPAPIEKTPIPSPLVAKSVMAEQGLYTKEQVQASQLDYFFQRENGEYFSTSAIDAWNQLEYMKSTKNRNLKFIGVSDGAVRRKMTQGKFKLIDALKKKIVAIGSQSMALNNEQGKLLGEKETPEIRARLEQIDVELEFIESEQKRVSDNLNEIEQEIFNAEIEDAKRRGGRIPDFSGVGDPKGLALYEGSTMRKD